MSILQDFEEARKMIGHKKYDAIDIYLNEICPQDNWKAYKKELKEIDHLEINEWEKQKKKLQQKYGIIFLDDVLYSEEGWNKFEEWYKNYISKEVKVKKQKTNENILRVKFIGIDNWDRPVYKDEKGNIFKDTNLGHGTLSLCTSVNNDFYGEPEAPINENIKVSIVSKFPNKPKNTRNKER